MSLAFASHDPAGDDVTTPELRHTAGLRLALPFFPPWTVYETAAGYRVGENMKYHLLLAFSFVACLHFVSSQDPAETKMPTSDKQIQCYVCKTVENGDKCSDENIKSNPDLLKNCSAQPGEAGRKANLCRKIRQWVDYEFEGLKAPERVVRTCGWEETNRDCYYRAGFGGRVDVCTCRENGCNVASSLTVSTLMVLLSTALLAIGALRHTAA